VKPYDFQEKVGFLEDLVKNHESQQILIHEEHDHLSGCTLFGIHSNYSTSIDLTLGILTDGVYVDKDDQVVIQTESYVHATDPEKDKNRWELKDGPIRLNTYQINCINAKRGQNVHVKDFCGPDMTKIVIGDENVGLYFKILSPYRHLFFDYLKDSEVLRKRRMNDLIISSRNIGSSKDYFDISYVSALKLLKHEEKIPLEFIAEFDKYKIGLIMEIEGELQIISGMENDIKRELKKFEDKIVARLVANRKRDELEYIKHGVLKKLETALELGMGNEERTINLGIPGKYINVKEYVTGLSKIFNVEKANRF
nr:hypothetical protein [Candidatus Woesearchaeota archaeon]